MTALIKHGASNYNATTWETSAKEINQQKVKREEQRIKREREREREKQREIFFSSSSSSSFYISLREKEREWLSEAEKETSHFGSFQRNAN